MKRTPPEPFDPPLQSRQPVPHRPNPHGNRPLRTARAATLRKLIAKHSPRW